MGRPDDAVPLALLMPSADLAARWEVDVWTVRRDLGEPRPRQEWQPLLALRPWPVFVAQVLQFQQLLADRLRPNGVAPTLTVADLTRALGELTAELRTRRISRPLSIADDLQSRLRGTSRATAVQTPSLDDLGLRWVPPAFFLPVPRELPVTDPADASVRSEAARLLGVAPSLFTCGTWDVGRLLESAQHADRTDLEARGGSLRVYVPVEDGVRVTDWVLVTAGDQVRPVQEQEGGPQ